MACGSLRRVERVATLKPFSYTSAGYSVMPPAMQKTVALGHLLGLRPRSPMPRVTTKRTYSASLRRMHSIIVSISASRSMGMSRASTCAEAYSRSMWASSSNTLPL